MPLFERDEQRGARFVIGREHLASILPQLLRQGLNQRMSQREPSFNAILLREAVDRPLHEPCQVECQAA